MMKRTWLLSSAVALVVRTEATIVANSTSNSSTSNSSTSNSSTSDSSKSVQATTTSAIKNLLRAAPGCVNPNVLASLPELPPGTTHTRHGAAVFYTGRPILLGGPASLATNDFYFEQSFDIMLAARILADHVNTARGGVRIGSLRHPLEFAFVGDGSSAAQIRNATAHATRCHEVDFVISGPTSGLTIHTGAQAYADGKLMLSGGAAATNVYTQNNLSFGTLPPAGEYLTSSIDAVTEAARYPRSRSNPEHAVARTQNTQSLEPRTRVCDADRVV
jgi:hypothetical protein